MKIDMNRLCRVFSRALDIIEEEQIGASQHHSARVAALCTIMGKALGYDEDTLAALAVSAMFHDNALTEYHLSELIIDTNGENLKRHCEKGQESVSWLPFKSNVKGFVLYHHERENGDGPFGKKAGEFPFEAALLAAADCVDVKYQLQNIDSTGLDVLKNDVKENAENYSTHEAVSVLLDVLNPDILEGLRDENITNTLDTLLPEWSTDITAGSVAGISEFIAHIIDYKSKFTQKHSSQIANRIWLMGKCYGYDETQLAMLYLAASLHDIGKIATPTQVLEKPGKLDTQEFEIIKYHVRNTHDWLSELPDFELVRNWAADHHEKIDGSGYSFGKAGDEIDFNARLMGCIDIYQAVCEERPYHEARSHSDTMPILYSMANKGFIDNKIVKDIDEIMEEYSLKDVPKPV